jgi:PadR family transcriptional regulator PadR
MNDVLDNWKIQIRKGYLELCILHLIQVHGRLYGFDLLDKLREIDLELKEGTLYPLLNRMTADEVLKAIWETENLKGHPRKFYSLSERGEKILKGMSTEFKKMIKILESIKE